MASLRTKLKGIISVIYAAFDSNQSNSSVAVAIPPFDFDWTSGTSSNQADQPWCRKSKALSNAAVDSWDLRALTSAPGGATMNMTEVRYIGLRMISGTSLLVAKGASNGFTGLGSAFSIVLKPGMVVWIADPTDGAHATGASDKVIDITAAGACVYDIAVIGTSA
jgi:hypothetical protein